MRDAAGILHSLQFIAPDGRKRFPQGGRVKGCYHAIGKPEGVIIICEGYATGASLHEATGQAVAVAFHAGNLPAVATALRSKYPGLNLIIAADDDWQAYDGNQGHAVDRISRGESFVPRVCLALLGGIQPSRVQGYVRDAVAGGAGDDGLLQRFGVAVWPDVTQAFEYVDRLPDTEAMQSAYAVFDRLNKLEPATDDEPQVWRFSTEAQALFEQWLTLFETEIRGEELHPALVSHLSKYRKLIPALALIFALVDTPNSNFLIHERELVTALEWGDYLRTHAERLYAAAVIPETAGAQTLLIKLRTGKLCDADGVLHESYWRRSCVRADW